MVTPARSKTADVARAADEKLVRACLDGDVDAWEALIRRHRRLIYSIPIKLGLDPADADEIFQQVALKLFEKLVDLRDGATLPAWLVVTTRRQCYAWVRRERRLAGDEEILESAAVDDDPAQGIHRVACEHSLALALDRLDAICRDLVTALYYEEPTPSYQELSIRFSRPVGSLGPTRNRCLTKLRKLYEGVGGPEY